MFANVDMKAPSRRFAGGFAGGLSGGQVPSTALFSKPEIVIPPIPVADTKPATAALLLNPFAVPTSEPIVSVSSNLVSVASLSATSNDAKLEESKSAFSAPSTLPAVASPQPFVGLASGSSSFFDGPSHSASTGFGGSSLTTTSSSGASIVKPHIDVEQIPLERNSNVVISKADGEGELNKEDGQWTQHNACREEGAMQYRQDTHRAARHKPSSLDHTTLGMSPAIGDTFDCRYCGNKNAEHFPTDCPRKRCSRCRQIGHPTRKCPNNIDIQCLRCLGTGHVSRECTFEIDSNGTQLPQFEKRKAFGRPPLALQNNERVAAWKAALFNDDDTSQQLPVHSPNAVHQHFGLHGENSVASKGPFSTFGRFGSSSSAANDEQKKYGMRNLFNRAILDATSKRHVNESGHLSSQSLQQTDKPTNWSEPYPKMNEPSPVQSLSNNFGRQPLASNSSFDNGGNSTMTPHLTSVSVPFTQPPLNSSFNSLVDMNKQYSVEKALVTETCQETQQKEETLNEYGEQQQKQRQLDEEMATKMQQLSTDERGAGITQSPSQLFRNDASFNHNYHGPRATAIMSESAHMQQPRPLQQVCSSIANQSQAHQAMNDDGPLSISYYGDGQHQWITIVLRPPPGTAVNISAPESFDLLPDQTHLQKPSSPSHSSTHPDLIEKQTSTPRHDS